MSAVKAVRFTRHYRIYNAGEVAGFDEAVADALIAAGYADPHQDEPPKPAKAATGAKPKAAAAPKGAKPKAAAAPKGAKPKAQAQGGSSAPAADASAETGNQQATGDGQQAPAGEGQPLPPDES